MTRSIKNLIAAVLIAISAYLAWTEALPAYTITSYLKERIEEKNALLISKTEIIDKISRLREENNSRYAQIQRLALVVPPNRALPEIISSIENIHSQSGVVLPELTIRDGKATDNVGNLVFTINDFGTYDKFINLLTYIEKNIRLYDVTKIEVSLKTEDSKEKNPEISILIEGQTYWLQPPVETPRPRPETTNSSVEQ